MQKEQRAPSVFQPKFSHLVRGFIIFVCAFSIFASGARVALAQVAQSAKNVQAVATAAGVGTTDLPTIIGRIIYVILSTFGVILLGYLLYAGYLWMTAGGEKTQVEKAKNIIQQAIIGILIVFAAFGITVFIMNALTDSTDSGGLSTFGGGGGGGLTGSSGSLGNGIIEYHLPERNATNVPRNTPVIITFKQPIQPASFIEGWTEANAADTHGLNVNAIKIFRTGDAATALTSAQVRVNFTEDRKTFVIRPVDLLGSPTINVKYTVQLAGGKTGILLANGDSAFSGSFSKGYEWAFEVSTVVDLTPPKVIAAIPLTGGQYPRNAVVSVTFNEAVDPISASGIFKNSAGFTNIGVRAGAALVEGEFKIVNQYRTVEFLTFDKCGMNSCGRDVFCLPGNAAMEVSARAATLSAQPPQAQLTNQGYDGITDVVGNSLDGNANDLAEGPDKDGYVWAFGTSNDIKLTPPKIIETVPEAAKGQGQSNRPLDEVVSATFDGLMQASTFNSSAAGITPSGPGEADPDTFWYTIGMSLLKGDKTPVKTGEAAAYSQLAIRHRPYSPSGLLPESLNYYNPYLLSDIQDAYQNCFNPSSSKTCAGMPDCCDDLASDKACPFK